jgi:hypothetical protein
MHDPWFIRMMNSEKLCCPKYLSQMGQTMNAYINMFGRRSLRGGC